MTRAAIHNGYYPSYHTSVKNQFTLIRDIPDLLTNEAIPVGIMSIVITKSLRGTVRVKKIEHYYSGTTFELIDELLPSFIALDRWSQLGELLE